MKTPQKLRESPHLVITSPSSGLAAEYPHRVAEAATFFRKRGFRVTRLPSTESNTGYESTDAETRAQEIMQSFQEPDVDVVMAAIGGMTANKVLKHLDFDVLREHPTWFTGYSDISVLHYAFYGKGIQTVYGPAAMTQFGAEVPDPYTKDWLFKVLRREDLGEVHPSEYWTDDFKDWAGDDEERTMRINEGYEWLQEGESTAPIIGGCLPSILRVAGTEYWPDHADHALFLETPEGNTPDAPYSLQCVDADLAQLESLGVLESIRGLVVGRAYQYSDRKIKKLKEIVRHYTESYDYPVMYGADIGHTDPMISIPLGATATLRSDADLFALEW